MSTIPFAAPQQVDDQFKATYPSELIDKLRAENRQLEKDIQLLRSLRNGTHPIYDGKIHHFAAEPEKHVTHIKLATGVTYGFILELYGPPDSTAEEIRRVLQNCLGTLLKPEANYYEVPSQYELKVVK